ncbi:P-loop containing nucleoside triphosphate hydrolase protein [Lyophyllum atratum]|nr:P-loop containing nucleoside triphosphate hydrolase protein [Lyophyllum atratum]
MSWGIFEVAYDDTSTSAPYPLYHRKSREMALPVKYVLRLFLDLHETAPRPFAVLVAGSIWMGVAPALSLYFSSSVLQHVQTSISTPKSTADSTAILMILASAWTGCAILSSLVEIYLDENRLILSAHLKAHFLPRLAKGKAIPSTDRSHFTDPTSACLDLDIHHATDDTVRTSLYSPWGFSEGAPALNFVIELSSKARDLLTASLEILVLTHITSADNNLNAFLIKLLNVLYITVVFLSPSNGVGNAGYTFWTKNVHYLRLCGLYSTIFDVKYREMIAKDGASERLHEEYKRTSDSLGVVKSDTLSLAWHIPPPWYWIVARTIIIDYPMAMYALTLPWSLSSTSLVTMALLQHTMTTTGKSIDRLRRFCDPSSVMIQVQQFYEMLDNANAIADAKVRYPTQTSSQRGIELSFRNVSYAYKAPTGGTGVLAVNDVSFNIEPGQLVAIVGGNASGKTSLLKLLAGLNVATRGEILIDNRPIDEYYVQDLRRSMAFIMQSEELYPMSLLDNFLMAIPDLDPERPDISDLVDEASRLGGAYDLVRRLGYNTILNSRGFVGQSVKGCGNGDIGVGAIEALRQNSPSNDEIILSGGERQRLVASRTFMRLKNSDIRLLVVDEPTSALDPIAERELFNNFCDLRNGKTVICVTHRFGNIVKRADLVLCMKGGKVIQSGTHETLMLDEKGEYRRLYGAQSQ